MTSKIEIIAKKFLKRKNKIVSMDEIKKILQSLGLETNLYKILYYLKNKGYLVSLKKDLFFVKKPEEIFEVDEIVENYYWDILYWYVKKEFGNNYFIGGIKALEIWNNNFSVPDKIVLVNNYKSSTITLVQNKKVLNTVYKLKGKDSLQSFKIFKKFTEKLSVPVKKFFVACYELSILEALYNIPALEEKYVFELVKKNVRKNYKRIDLSVFEFFLQNGKYGKSCERLYQIAQFVNPNFSEKLKLLLKKYYRF